MMGRLQCPESIRHISPAYVQDSNESSRALLVGGAILPASRGDVTCCATRSDDSMTTNSEVAVKQSPPRSKEQKDKRGNCLTQIATLKPLE